MSAVVSPNPGMPHIRQVDGRNCIGPSAPAFDGPSLVPCPLSICPIAASTVQESPGQYLAADCLYRSMYVLGRLASAPGSTGNVDEAACRSITWLCLPSNLRTCWASVAMLAPGALIMVAMFGTRPSTRAASLLTSASTPGTPRWADAPMVTTGWPAPTS